MSFWFYAGLFAVSVLGAFVQAVVGFGAAVFLLLYTMNFMSMSQAPSVGAVVCLVLNLSMFLRYRKYFQLKPVIFPALIYSAVSLVTVFLLKNFHVRLLTILFGVFLILISIYYLFLSGRIAVNGTGVPMMLVSSGVSGLFAGMFSIGGPTLSIYFLALCGTGGFYISSLQFSFLATNIALVTGRVVNGLITADMIPMFAAGIAGALAGQLAGDKVRDRLGSRVLSMLVYAFVGVSGIIVIAQQFLQK